MLDDGSVGVAGMSVMGSCVVGIIAVVELRVVDVAFTNVNTADIFKAGMVAVTFSVGNRAGDDKVWEAESGSTEVCDAELVGAGDLMPGVVV